MITRRTLLGSAALTVTWPGPAPLASPAREARFVLLILRGGLDGLAAVPAYGDADYQRARGGLAEAEPGEADGLLDLDGFFGLHPALPGMHDLYRARELAVLHALAPPYRARSHFDGQDVLEAGVPDPSGASTGWLYRALGVLPGAADPSQMAMALGGAVPLVLRGARPVGAWAPDALPNPDEDTLARVLKLYAEDPLLGPSLASGMASNAMAGTSGVAGRQSLAVAARAAIGFLSHPEGPRIAVLEGGGWDTHTNQRAQLSSRLAGLDEVIVDLRTGLGEHWADTTLVVVTEFGRTVAMNGTRGTDHGVGGVAFVMGGPVAGGRVYADWPGLASGRLYQGRDLQPTTDVRGLFRSVLVDHLRADANAVDEVVFPDARLPGIDGLIHG